jgi:hypothetical protein
LKDLMDSNPIEVARYAFKMGLVRVVELHSRREWKIVKVLQEFSDVRNKAPEDRKERPSS